MFHPSIIVALYIAAIITLKMAAKPLVAWGGLPLTLVVVALCLAVGKRLEDQRR